MVSDSIRSVDRYRYSYYPVCTAVPRVTLSLDNSICSATFLSFLSEPFRFTFSGICPGLSILSRVSVSLYHSLCYRRSPKLLTLACGSHRDDAEITAKSPFVKPRKAVDFASHRQPFDPILVRSSFRSPYS